MVFYCTCDVFAEQSLKFIMRGVSFGMGGGRGDSSLDLDARVGQAFFASSVFTLVEYLVRYGHLSLCCSNRYAELGEDWGEKFKARGLGVLLGMSSSFLFEKAREMLFLPSDGNTQTWEKTFLAALPFLIATEGVAYFVSGCDRLEQEAFDREMSVTISRSDQSLSIIQSSGAEVANYSQLDNEV